MKLKTQITEASKFIEQEFNLSLLSSNLKIYSSKNWSNFCDINQFSKNSDGIYIPASLTAYVQRNSPYLISDIFHEYFGHGLFSEQSQIGNELVSII